MSFKKESTHSTKTYLRGTHMTIITQIMMNRIISIIKPRNTMDSEIIYLTPPIVDKIDVFLSLDDQL